MRQSFQLALNFNDSQLDNTTMSEIPPEIPIDKYFPEDEANKLAALESYNKHLYRPNTYLHKWWARRSGTTFRYILKQLVQHSGKRNFYEGGGLESKIIFDPMMGGGTILHEAIRMGASVIGIDIDPIPVLQNSVYIVRAA
jgi:adenine-specific DNA methylase